MNYAGQKRFIRAVVRIEVLHDDPRMCGQLCPQRGVGTPGWCRLFETALDRKGNVWRRTPDCEHAREGEPTHRDAGA